MFVRVGRDKPTIGTPKAASDEGATEVPVKKPGEARSGDSTGGSTGGARTA
jgi:hypothetical protein